MLEKESLDIVSVCTWPALHEPMVVAASQAASRRFTAKNRWQTRGPGSKRMVEVCRANGTLLTFNHQRRFGAPFARRSGSSTKASIGALRRLEISFGNLYDYGSHKFDMSGYFNDERPAVWVIAQIDYETRICLRRTQREPSVCALAVRKRSLRDGVYGKRHRLDQMPQPPGRKRRRDRGRCRR